MASKKYRDKLKLQRFNNQQSTTYKSRQAFGKAVKRTFQSLPKDPSKRVDVIHHIAQVLNVIPAPKHHKPEHRSLSNALKELVINFYNRDDVSYQMPGKWDCITVDNDDKKITLQKRILLYSIRETYQLFIADKNDPNINLSKTSFSDLRPLNILVQSHMSHRSCLCVYHENINLPLKALSKQIQCPDLNTLQAFSLALVCDEEDEKLIDQKKEIKWYQWILNEGFAKKQEFNDTIQQCLADLQEKIKPFLWHVFIKRQQTSYFEQMKSSTNDMKQMQYKVLTIQKNLFLHLLLMFGAQVKVFHLFMYWITVHMINIASVRYWINYSMRLKKNSKICKTFMFFSDGAAQQFKQRFLFRNLCRLADLFKIVLSWYYFATSHGKGVVDGLVATVKRLAYSAILAGQHCNSAADFVVIPKSKTNAIEISEIKLHFIDDSMAKMESIFKSVKPILETKETHSIKVLKNNAVECKYYSHSKTSRKFKF
ncbi:unnamed protein product [Rotaria magnacalcarata]|uniref:Uncharacterized protein n=1 Tax=Rotaria magnacalcarata TaxID=392030 RepID=A0A8S2PZP7_9BILA|nr:unnamed protein product [Rotaria magnacalcarata]